MKCGKLFIVATPIGNLKDITFRAIEILAGVDLIAAEDTRHTRRLLTHYSIKTPITSYHEHNERNKTALLIDWLKGGADLALVSDAGTPGLSDPGYRLIAAAIEEGIELSVIPGPSSLISALVISGLATDSFIFLGFLPKGRAERRKLLKGEAASERTLIFFESPHRIETFLTEALDILGDRKLVIVRELTKKFEEVIRGRATEVLERVKKKALKGEMVVMVEGARLIALAASFEELKEEVIALMGQGVTKKEAIAEVALRRRIPKKEVFEAVKGVSANSGPDFTS
ncbi:MAG: 16S rRNA (cytidine(1402)-2'-O)-methyltransferase [Actinomycetota bacterium]|nr:16S rRNA (cytidine(1402)-2'-O)-methyltransferase [Actinomycetota bacterium]